MPEVGASSPPSRCSKVLLPEPDAPTMASVWPAWTCRSTPCKTRTSRRPSVKRLVRPRACRTAPWAPAPAAGVSFMAHRLGRVHPAGTPTGVEGGNEGQRQRDHGNRHDVAALRLAGHFADQVDVLGQKARVQRLLDGRHD